MRSASPRAASKPTPRSTSPPPSPPTAAGELYPTHPEPAPRDCCSPATPAARRSILPGPSYGDLGTYNGWLWPMMPTTLAQVAVWNDTLNGAEGGIWMSNGGIAVDSSGALYVSTGNGTFDDTADLLPPMAPNNDFGESFVKLDPSALTSRDYYTPRRTPPGLHRMRISPRVASRCSRMVWPERPPEYPRRLGQTGTSVDH